MFGHDNQDNNDQNDNGGGQITLPSSDEQAETLPVTAPQAPDTELGDFTPTSPRTAPKTGAPTDDLLDIKQEALQALTPLVDHLDQTPEERFRTTMMMIQASDNHSLLKVAYDAAQKIADDKERAQALLDIVNEINYFTQHNQAA